MDGNDVMAGLSLPPYCNPGYGCLQCPYPDCIYPKGGKYNRVAPVETYMLSLVGMARYCEKRKKKKTGRRTEMETGMKKAQTRTICLSHHEDFPRSGDNQDYYSKTRGETP